MAYQKQQFKDYEILTGEQLNHIEDGIVAAENNANSRVKTVNGKNPDINGNVEITIPDNIARSEDVDAVDEKVETLREVVSKFHSNIVEEANGDIIYLDDSSDMELAGLKVFGKTAQNTTTGKNLFGIADAESTGTTTTYNVADGTITRTAKVAYDTTYLVANDLLVANLLTTVLSAGTYTFSLHDLKYTTTLKPTGIYLEVTHDDGSKTQMPDGKATTLTSSATITNIRCNTLSMQTGKYVSYKCQIEAGEIATDFEPYTGGIPSPNPDYPQPLESVGDGGSVTVKLGISETDENPQTLTISTPNGLPGIPVTSGGNYTDENGQQWVCDEVDFARAVYAQRIGKIDSYTSEEIPGAYISTTGGLSAGATVLYALPEPIEHDLTAEELAQYATLHTNYPNTTIVNDVGAGMEVTYVADTKLYIDKKFDQLAQAMLNQ